MARDIFENDVEVSDFVPWDDTSLWEPGKHYPLPHSESAEFGGITLDVFGVSWGVYKLDPDIDKESKLYGDIVSILHGLHMKDACMAANYLNEA